MPYLPFEEKNGNLLDAPEEIKVIPVNCVGVMGKGLALAFKKLHPDIFRSYAQLCSTRKLRVGHPVELSDTSNLYIMFPTKNNWRDPSELSWIKDGLDYMVEAYASGTWKRPQQGIAMPPLGCGLGGLKIEQVRPLIVDFRVRANIRTVVYTL